MTKDFHESLWQKVNDGLAFTAYSLQSHESGWERMVYRSPIRAPADRTYLPEYQSFAPLGSVPLAHLHYGKIGLLLDPKKERAR